MIKHISFFSYTKKKNGENCGECKMQFMNNGFNNIQSEWFNSCVNVNSSKDAKKITNLFKYYEATFVLLLLVLQGDYAWKHKCYQWRKNASVFLDVRLRS